MIPLFYDWLFGMVVPTRLASGPTRTAFLHVDYRSITPIDEPLTARGRITEIDGRKIFISASMTAADGTAAQRSHRPDGPVASPPAVRGTDVRHRNTIHGTRCRQGRRGGDSGPRPADPGRPALHLRAAIERSNHLAAYLHSRGLGCHTERSELAGHEVGQDLLGIYALQRERIRRGVARQLPGAGCPVQCQLPLRQE